MATPYLRGKKYYFKYTDSEGKRKQKCTDTDDYEKACAFISAFDASIQEKKFVMPTFLEELHKYQDINTNPKYQRVLLEGGNYSKPWAIRVASYTKQLEGIIKATTPSVLLKKLNEVSRMEISDISKAIAKARGKSRTSQLMQQSLKVVFSTAYEDGVLPFAFHPIRVLYEMPLSFAKSEKFIPFSRTSSSKFAQKASKVFSFLVMVETY